MMRVTLALLCLACLPAAVATLARLSSSEVMRDEREGLAMSALRPEADIWAGVQHVCFGQRRK